MTVCIAAADANGSIWGASDRMVTSDDVEFEPELSKIFGITSSIVMMTAGDSALQAEIVNLVWREVNERIRE